VKIECILKRPGGTKAEIGGTEYHFEPQADGAHVAEVKDDAHIQRFLGIPEGYRIYKAAGKQAAAPEPATDDTTDDADDTLDGDLNGDGVVDDKDERIALAAAYEAKFGKKPNGRMSLATLRQQVAE
jgi:hypothetical protein